MLAASTPARRDNLAQALATSSPPIRAVAWTTRHSPLEALSAALATRPHARRPPLASAEIPAPDNPTDPAPPPAPHA